MVGNTAYTNIAYVLKVRHMYAVQIVLCGNKVGTTGKVSGHQEKIGLILALGLRTAAHCQVWNLSNISL